MKFDGHAIWVPEFFWNQSKGGEIILMGFETEKRNEVHCFKAIVF